MEQGSVGVAGTDAVDANSLGAVVDRHGFRELNYGSLGRTVDRCPGSGYESPSRGSVDDGTAPALLHVRDRASRHEIDRLDVDLHHPVPVLLGRLENRGPTNDAGVVDQDVESVSDLQSRCYRRIAILRSCHVGGDGTGGSSGAADVPSEVLDTIGVQIHRTDGGAVTSEKLRHRVADSGGRAGDEGGSTLQVELDHHGLLIQRQPTPSRRPRE